MTLDAKKILKVISLSIFLLFIIIFAFFTSKDLIFGVRIKDVRITVPEASLTENSISKASRIRKITGNAKNAVVLTLNDRIIYVDQVGNFDETIVLYPGYNIINVKAKDEFGHSDEKNYKLMATQALGN